MKIRSILAFLCLSLCFGRAFAQIALHQSIAFAYYAVSTTTQQITFGSTMSNPSLIVVIINVEGRTISISSIADNKNAGNYSQDVSVTNTSGSSSGEGTSAVFSMQNTQTAAATITITLSATTSKIAVGAYELTGAATSSALDKTATQFLNTGSTSVGYTLSGTTANDAVFSVITMYPAPTAAVDSGFTAVAGSIVSGFSNKHYGEYNLGAGGGNITIAYGGSWTPTAFATAAAAYKEFGAPSGPPPSQFFLGESSPGNLRGMRNHVALRILRSGPVLHGEIIEPLQAHDLIGRQALEVPVSVPVALKGTQKVIVYGDDLIARIGH